MEDENKTSDHSAEESPCLKERYELLIKARNFHYENYSKWMTYFYVAIGSIFVAFYTIASKDDSVVDKQLLEMSILALGYIVSILWYWSCKGYYFWNIQFITLINYYENDLFKWPKEKRVYFVFANKHVQNNYSSPISGANVSTSKVAILFSYLVTSFWGFLVSFKIISEFYDCNCNLLILISSIVISFVSIFLLSTIIPQKFLFSKIDHMPNLVVTQNISKSNSN